jgi:spore germination cell wall hydrolase CwlJ-like protein
MPRLALMFVLGLVMIATPAVAAVLRTVTFERLIQPRAEAVIDWTAAPDPNQVQPFILHASSAAERATALKCLAEAVYYEAGFQPQEGQRAVAQVVLNRVRDRNFPDSVCGVVYEGAGRRTGCQFTFVCDGSLTRRPPSAEQLAKARIIAEQAIDGYVVAEVGTATHYHTDYVDPYWRESLREVAKVGDHIFYSWPGKAGQPAALSAARYAGGEVDAWRTEARLALSRAA